MSNWNDVIDYEVLDELREMLEDGIDEYMEQFYEDLTGYSDGLPCAVSSGNADATYQIVHSLASSCGYVGAKQVVSVARELEALARKGDLAQAPALVDQLNSNIDQMRIALADLCV